MISVVSPVYLAEKILPELVSRIAEELNKLQVAYEIILVDDSSPDNSWYQIEKLCTAFPFVKGIKLSRNFGQHYAITAGVAEATGEVVVLMDCDLQDDPADIALLLDEYQKSYQVVFTRRIERKHSPSKKLLSWLYKKSFALLSDKYFDIHTGSLVLFSSQVRSEFLRISDQDRLYIQLLKWVGFKSITVPVKHCERYSGKSSYTFMKMMRLAVQGWTFHSEKLLKFAVYMGFTLSSIALIGILYIVAQYYLTGFQSGWASLAVLLIFSTGVIQLSIGILGIYIGKVFRQVKNRPLYIIEKKVNG